MVLVLLVSVTLPSADKPLTASEVNVPTLVKEELVIPEPIAVAVSTEVPLM